MERPPNTAKDASAMCMSCGSHIGNTGEIRYVCSKCDPNLEISGEPHADGGTLTSGQSEFEPRSSAQTVAQLQETTHVTEGPLLPADSELKPDISFVFPTMNEEDGVGTAIDWAVEALRKLGLYGEIIVSDSSTDQTPEIAREKGAIIVEPNKLGYGYAYRYGFQFVRGEYVVMGDPDCTYDFTELPRLLEQIEKGDADIVMGSRFQGKMEPGAMPPLHKYVGNPLLTKFLNVFYDAGVTDAHSGFRVFTRDVLHRLDLQSDGMEFASEMVMEATAKGLTIQEVPIRYRERKGEETLDSFHDGWRHVKFMLLHAPGYLFALPGALLAIAGVVLMGLSVFNFQPGPFTFGTHTMILGSLSLIVGFNIWELAMFSSIAANPIRSANDPVTRWVKTHFQLEHGIIGGTLLLGLGTVYGLFLVWQWFHSGFTQLPLAPMDMVAFTAIVLGLETVFSSFYLGAVAD